MFKQIDIGKNQGDQNGSHKPRDQSFTSLKADLRQDINGGLVFSRCLNGIFP